ncbi:MAG: hypothetical protein ACI4IQ_06185, partial [Eubacterium sp.]
KKIYKIIILLTFILFCYFTYKRITINYAYIYPVGRSCGIEYSLLYTMLSIELFVLIVFLLCFFNAKKLRTNKKAIFISVICIILVLIGSIVFSLKAPKTFEYQSSQTDNKTSAFFPIDSFEYKEPSQNYYYFKQYQFSDTSWIGCCSYKDFASENPLIDLTEEISDSTVFMNYYYLKDSKKHKIKEFNFKRNLYDLSSSNIYVSEIHKDNYSLYEYEDNYEFILIDDETVFYLSSSKNNKTEYDPDTIVNLSLSFVQKLENKEIFIE